MTLDDKLKGWRETTETVVPSAALMASLTAQVEAAPAPSAPAGATLTTVVKVVGVAVFFGVLTWALWPRESIFAIRSMATSTAGFDAGEAACPPRPPTTQAAAPMAIRAPNWEESLRIRQLELERILAARPMTCEGQKAPLTELLQSGTLTRRQWEKAFTRYVALCGIHSARRGAMLAPMPPRETVVVSGTSAGGGMAGCDDSDWCHLPSCGDAFTEDCARAYAARPAHSCSAVMGRAMLADFACERLVRGQGSEGEVRAHSLDAWCLSDAVYAEADAVRAAAAAQPAVPRAP